MSGVSDSVAHRVSFSLDFEAKWWLPVPVSFPHENDVDVLAWADRLIDERPVGAPWTSEPFESRLRELIAVQYLQLHADRSAALWYCPFGLPAAGVVELFIVPRPDGERVDPAALLAGLQSDLQIRPETVSTGRLGPGIGYTRVWEGVAEMGYVFAPAGASVRVVARSSEPQVLGMMGQELWTVVESISISEEQQETP